MHPNRYIELLTPSAIGGLFYVVGGVAVMLLSSFTNLINQLIPPIVQRYWDGLLHSYTNTTLNRIDRTANFDQAATILLWVVIGVVLYALFWLAINSYIALHNDIVVASTYTNFKPHEREEYWFEIIFRGLFRACMVVLILFLLSIAMPTLYTFSVATDKAWLSRLSSPVNWLLLVSVFLGWLALLHVSVILLRLSLLRTRVVG